MNKFLKDIITSQDNKSFSSKRVAGWLSLICTFVYAFAMKQADHDIFFGMCGLTTGFWALTSVDNRTAVKAGETDGKNP